MTRERWAYRSYDCVPALTGPLTVVEIGLTAGINSRVSGAPIAGVTAVLPEVNEALCHLLLHQTFWDIQARVVARGPLPGRPWWWMHRALWLLEGVRGVDVAIAHKTLHHKRPALFPLLDGKTLRCYPQGRAWPGIHAELTSQRSQFEQLEAWFADCACGQDAEGVDHEHTETGPCTCRLGSVPLMRLRLHDILLWCDVTGERAAAAAAGKDVC
jgi:hypothetical protein